MKEINIVTSNHEFTKQNLTTIFEGGKYYDLLKCKYCGLKGKQVTLGVLQIDGRLKAAERCLGRDLQESVTVTNCSAQGKIFSNLVSGSVHKTINPPKGKNNNRGVWVMGVGEPVMLLFGEYTDNIE